MVVALIGNCLLSNLVYKDPPAEDTIPFTIHHVLKKLVCVTVRSQNALSKQNGLPLCGWSCFQPFEMNLGSRCQQSGMDIVTI